MDILIVQPQSVADAWNLYTQHLREAGRSQHLSLTKTALLRYTLPGYGWQPPELNRRDRDQDAIRFMQTLPVNRLLEGANIQQTVFEQLSCQRSLQQSNRYRLKRFLQWCAAQPWWTSATRENGADCAPKRRNSQGSAHHVKVSGRNAQQRYSLKYLKSKPPLESTDRNEPVLDAQASEPAMQSQLDRIAAELEAFYQFRTRAHIPSRQEGPVRASTARKDQNRIYLILGWLYHYEQVPLVDLGLKTLDDISLAYDYTEWLRETRDGGAASELQAVVGFLNVAKFLHHQDSNQKHCEALTKSYVDIEIINQLRKLNREISKRLKASPRAQIDESKKWLDWPQYLACLDYLKRDCSPLASNGRQRTEQAIARSYERYLIAAFLGYMPPDRQRTFRELEEGRTLVRGHIDQGLFSPHPQGQWYVRLGADDYKTGATYGEQIIPVPETLYPELEAWLNRWRACLNPSHTFVFTQLNGKPLTAMSLYQLFRHAIYRASLILFGEGKATNPQLVRTILITHCFRMGASDAEMEALAIGMKHSRRMQRQVYDRRTQQEKIQPALDLMARLGGAAASS